MEFQVEEHAGHRAVVAVSGRLDANNADMLKAALKDAVANGLTRLIIDMQAVSFIDSSGLSALVSGFKAAREQGGALALAGVGPQINVALELTRLNRVFTVHDDVDSALGSFES